MTCGTFTKLLLVGETNASGSVSGLSDHAWSTINHLAQRNTSIDKSTWRTISRVKLASAPQPRRNGAAMGVRSMTSVALAASEN